MRSSRLALATAVAAATLAALTAPPATARWTTVAGPESIAVSPRSLDSVVALSSNDAWAAGYGLTLAGSVHPLIAHWGGRAWRLSGTPAVTGNFSWLRSLAASGPANVWALGDQGSRTTRALKSKPLVLRYGGRAWSRASTRGIPSGAVLLSIATAGSDDVWAVGYSGERFLAVQWTGRAWTATYPPVPADTGNPLGPAAGDIRLNAVRFIPGTRQVIAIGNYVTPQFTTLIYVARWDGSSWQQLAAPAGDTVYGLAALSADDLWTSCDCAGSSLGHFSAGGWQPVSSPHQAGTEFVLGQVAAGGPRDIWAVGLRTPTSSSTGTGGGTVTGAVAKTLAEHYDGHAWSVVRTPNPERNSDLLAVSAVPGTRQFWAVGCGPTPCSADNEASTAIILHWR